MHGANTSNIKCLQEMEEVFKNDLNRKTIENTNQPANENDNAEQRGSNSDYQIIAGQQVNKVKDSSTTATTSTPISNKTDTPSRGKKRSRDIVKAISDLKTLHEEVNSVEETPFDIFGKSVAMQLKTFLTQNALLAQAKIQSVLTEIGIHDYRKRTGSLSLITNFSSPVPSPLDSNSNTTNVDEHTSSSNSELTSLETGTTSIITLALNNAYNC
uniref:Uncharacterized protein LOC114341965 n=1 Tax=Diabrotica virgifera virgifera TaxID=50390 RepID=A0A6P7GFW2_DIAVI